jgi:hypothetical protein
MVEVGRFDTRAEAEIGRSLLAAAGIPCVLAPGERTHTRPIDVSGAARLLVAEADAHQAAAILSRDVPCKEGG